MIVVCWSLHRSWTQDPKNDDEDTQDASSVGCGDMGQDGVNLGLPGANIKQLKHDEDPYRQREETQYLSPALLWAWALLM